MTTSKSSKKNASKENGILNFEKALAELEAIVARMEGNQQSLEDALADYERGMTLSTLCQQHLDKAELRVQKLTKKAKEYQLEPLDPESSD